MKGRPVLGAFSGLFFGVFLMLDLIFLKVVKSDMVALWALPVLFLLAGVMLGRVAPIKRAAK